MRTKKFAILAPAIAFAIALAGCSAADSTPEPTPADNGTTAGTGSVDAAAAAEAVAAGALEATAEGPLGTPLSEAADLTGKTVYYIPISLQVPYFAIELDAVTEALESVGATVRGCDGQFAPTSVVQCMDQAIGAGAAAVVTSAVPYEMASAGYEKLRAANIPTQLAIAAPPADGNIPEGLHYLEQEFMTHPAQRLASKAIIADSDGKANVLFMKIIDSAALIGSGQAGIDEFAENCAECVVEVVEVSGARADEIPSVVSTKLLANPNIDYIMPQTAAHLANTITGIQNANATDRVKIATTTGSLAGLQVQKSNPAVLANASSSIHYSGWIIGDSVVRMIVGDEVPTTYPPVYRIFEASNIGSLDLTPEAERTNAWFGPATYVEGFQALWAGE